MNDLISEEQTGTMILDPQICCTIFSNLKGLSKKEHYLTIDRLWRILQGIRSTEKSKSKLVKLAKFGSIKSNKGSLRHDQNILEFHGIEADYDAGEIDPESARLTLLQAGIKAIVVTTHSHESNFPRWRILAPFRTPTSLKKRNFYLSYIDRLFDNTLAKESYTASQAFFVGRPHNGEYECLQTFEDADTRYIDEIEVIAAINESTNPTSIVHEPTKRSEMLQDLIDGSNLHDSACRLAASFANSGYSQHESQLLFRLMQPHLYEVRGKDRVDEFFSGELHRIISSAESKFKPVPLALPNRSNKTPKLLRAMLPKVIRDYVYDIAERQQCAPDFCAITAICAFSSIVGRKFKIRPKRNDDWVITPNSWGVIIGRPSAMKSPSMKATLEPVTLIERSNLKKFHDEMDFFEIDSQLQAAKTKDARKKSENLIRKDKQDEARELLLSTHEKIKEPVRRRLKVNDASVEKLGELFNENPNGLLLVRDELAGWLNQLLKEDGQSQRAFYLECFDGDTQYTYDRIGRGTIEIPSCTLSIIGAIQPSRIARLVHDAQSEKFDDGLLQRLQLLCWPDDEGSWKWIDREPNKEAQEAYSNTFMSMYELVQSIDSSQILRFSEEAQETFKEWMEEIQVQARASDCSRLLEGYLLKLPKTVSSLALLFELIEGGRQEVSQKSIEMALLWSEYLIGHATKLYESSERRSIDAASLILKRRDRLSQAFTCREVMRKNWAGLGSKQLVLDALDCLVEFRHLKMIEDAPKPSGGRSTYRYEWIDEQPSVLSALESPVIENYSLGNTAQLIGHH